MSIAQKFGHPQGSDAFSALAIPINDSAILDSRAEMFAYIDLWVNHKVEQFFLPMLGDLLASTTRGFKSTFTPIETMRAALFTGTDAEEAERHMIAFLHEVQTGLADAIVQYKTEYPRYIFSTSPQTYANGRNLLSESSEQALLAALRGSVTFTYATGPIGEYFRSFMKKCYERATTLLALSKQFDGSNYEKLPAEHFSRMAKVVNGETPGFKIEVVDPSEYYYATLHGQQFSLYQRHAPIHIAYEDLENIRLASPYGRSTATKNVIKLTNTGFTAMVAKVGATAPVESAINPADHSNRTQITTPSEHEFTKAQLASSITFEEMQKPVANTLPDIDLQVGDIHTISLANAFSGKFIADEYTLNSLRSDKISVALNHENNTCVIVALKRGRAMFNIIARNPAGRTPLEVDISISE